MVDDAREPEATHPHAATARDLLGRLTLDEKLAMLHQVVPATDRLGLAAFRTGTEALHGVAWLGVATVLPQPVGLAATWDPGFLERLGGLVGTEVRAKHAADPSVSLNVWAPVVNPLRHPRWGRTEEGYSEDPDLTARLASGYARGLRGDAAVWRTVPTLKHVLGYGNETDRSATSSHLPPQALREYELPAYLGPVRDGVVGALMPSYNLVNGRPAHVCAELLDELRAHADGDLAVVSDAAAPSNLAGSQRYFADHVTSHAALVRSGVDSCTDNDADAGPTVARLRAALDAGLLDEADVDRAVHRMLVLRARTGELTPDEDPYRTVGPDALDLPAHRALARRAVARSVVLLENDGVLPLGAPATVAVVGPFADHVVHDWYSGTPPYRSSLAAALHERYPDARVRVADGADRVALRSVTTGRHLVVSDDAAALHATGDGADPRAHLDVTDWGDGLLTLRSVGSGRLLTGASWVVAADAERVGGWVAQESFRWHRHDDATVSIQHVASGRWLRVQHGTALLVADGTPATAERFVVRTVRSGTQEVARVCAGADVVVAAVGNDPHLLGRETEDRPGTDLPQPQQEVWRIAAESGAPAVLLMVSSYPYTLGALADDAAAVVWTSHGAQELGRGLVDVLSGDAEPSGRLAQTWWADGRDAGDLLEYDVVQAGMTYRYATAQPRWALGHGLTYARVAYEGLRLTADRLDAPAPTLEHTPARWSPDAAASPAGSTGAARDGATDRADVTVVVTVRNTGQRPARELVAVHVRAPELPVRAPRVRLAGWTHVDLAPGERRDVALPLLAGHLAVWDVAARAAAGAAPATPGAYRVQPGTYTVATGTSAADVAASATLEVVGAPPAPRRASVLAAHGFHASHGLVTTPRSPTHGSAVEPAPGAPSAWGRYDGIDLTGRTELRLTVARQVGSARPTASLTVQERPAGDAAATWRALATVDVPPDDAPGDGGSPDRRTGGPAGWREVRVPIGPRHAVADLRVVLRGGARLAELSFG